MLHTAEIDMADSVTPDDVDVFLNNVAWAICSTYHTVLKASPGAAIFRRDMLFDIPFIANWNKIGDYRQHQIDLSTACKNKKCVHYDYKVGDRVLVVQDGILHKKTKPTRQGAMDFNNGAYKWNYQDSMQNQIGTNKYPESNSLY
jgi:hypothetical protein